MSKLTQPQLLVFEQAASLFETCVGLYQADPSTQRQAWLSEMSREARVGNVEASRMSQDEWLASLGVYLDAVSLSAPIYSHPRVCGCEVNPDGDHSRRVTLVR